MAYWCCDASQVLQLEDKLGFDDLMPPVTLMPFTIYNNSHSNLRFLSLGGLEYISMPQMENTTFRVLINGRQIRIVKEQSELR